MSRAPISRLGEIGRFGPREFKPWSSQTNDSNSIALSSVFQLSIAYAQPISKRLQNYANDVYSTVGFAMTFATFTDSVY